jgi:two-component system sensor histidine kinase RegB
VAQHVRHSHALTLQTLVTTRWLLLGLWALVFVVRWWSPPSADHALGWTTAVPPWRAGVAVLLVWGSCNLGTRLWAASRDVITPGFVGAQVLLDLLVSLVLLQLSGGADHPFTALLLVPIVLATALSPRWAAVAVGVAVLGFGALMVANSIAHGGSERPGLLHGSWLALLCLGALVAWLVQQLMGAQSRSRAELEQLRDATIQDQHLAALGTLAAGAAHELGTPLGTVNLLAGELPHMEPEEQRTAIDTIKREVERCKDILHRMASPEVRVSALSARDAQPWFLCELQDELDDPEGVKLTFVATAATRELRGTTTLARASLGQIVRELVTNAAEACRRKPGTRGVTVRIDVDGDEGVIEVEDDGAGMEPSVAAMVFDPFFSTKPEGQGMGLGLYLAQAQMRQLGGRLDLQSTPGRGTKVTVRVTLRPPDPMALLGPMTGLGR